jgi:sugar lactone lactonase YvrE
MLWRYDVVGPGSLANKTAMYDFGADGPDGMAVAEDGTLWVAMAGAGCVLVLGADGSPRGQVVMPTAMVTSLCFGGPDRRTLYICTGGHGDGTRADDRHGAVYRARSALPGLALAPARVRLAPAATA